MSKLLEKEHQTSLLEAGILKVAREFPDGVDISPQPPDNMFFDNVIISTSSVEMIGDRVCAVLNAIRALGIDPQTTPREIATRLVAANRQGGDLLEESIRVDDRVTYQVTDQGIGHLFVLAQHPLGKLELKINITEATDLGDAHYRLARGGAGVFVDEQTRKALTIGGVRQYGNQAQWCIIAPEPVKVIGLFSSTPDTIIGVQTSKVLSKMVNPRLLVNKIQSLWIVDTTF